MRFTGWNWSLIYSYWPKDGIHRVEGISSFWEMEHLEHNCCLPGGQRSIYISERTEGGGATFPTHTIRSTRGCALLSSPKGRLLWKLEGVREMSLVLQPQNWLGFLLYALRGAGIICFLLTSPQEIVPVPSWGQPHCTPRQGWQGSTHPFLPPNKTCGCGRLGSHPAWQNYQVPKEKEVHEVIPHHTHVTH